MQNYEILMQELGTQAKQASYGLQLLHTSDKNRALVAMSDALLTHVDELLAANEKDILAAKDNGVPTVMIDRLRLTKDRIIQMAEGVQQVVTLPDPIGEVTDTVVRPNGLSIRKVVVPLGVIAIIYEARPNVTVDAAALCLKTGNAVILRGGKEAIHSNQCLVTLLRDAIESVGVPVNAIQLVTVTDREAVPVLLKQRSYIDVVIPRGGAGLIRRVCEESSIPVIETGSGVCHIYIDKAADWDMALRILLNAKVQRPSVCNAAETVLLHEAWVPRIPELISALQDKGVAIYGDQDFQKAAALVQKAEDDQYHVEYNDLIINAKVVHSLADAIAHIQRYGTKHSECIVTEDKKAATQFQLQVDAAAVYVNASTRFTDGFEFGFGAEIGISTQKLHARGPMGLSALTSYKYLIDGDGQIRE